MNKFWDRFNETMLVASAWAGVPWEELPEAAKEDFREMLFDFEEWSH